MHMTSLITSMNNRPNMKPYKLVPKKLKTKSQVTGDGFKEHTSPNDDNNQQLLPGLTPPQTRGKVEGFIESKGMRLKLPQQQERTTLKKKSKLP